MLVALPDDVRARVAHKYGSPCRERGGTEDAHAADAAVTDGEGDAPLLSDDASPAGNADGDAAVVVRVAADSHAAHCGRLACVPRRSFDLEATSVRATQLPRRVLEALETAPCVGVARVTSEGTVLVVRDGVQMAVVADDRTADVLLRAAHLDPSLCATRAAGARWLRGGAWDAWLASLDGEAVA